MVVISIDSLRADHLGCYGYSRPTSPRIDAVARNGVVYENAFSTTSWTLPSHMALFTGMYDTVHGVTTHREALDPLRVTLPEVFQSAGYRTAGFFSGPYLIPAFGFGKGFDKYIACFDYLEPAELSHKDSRGYKPETHMASHSDITSPRIHRDVRRWLDEGVSEPYFLFVHMWDVHYDYVPPGEYATRFTDPGYESPLDFSSFETNAAINAKMDPRDLAHLVGLYDGEIAYTDAYLGKILDDLDERGLLENTIVVITSDHGEAFFEHGQKGHQKDLFDEVLHVPFIVSWPGHIAPRRLPQQISLIDMMPTLLELASLEVPSESNGHSLAPALLDREPPRDSLVFSELTMDDVKFRRHLRALRTPQYKVIYNVTPGGKYQGQGVLYDLQRDPGERRSLGAGDAPFADEAVRRLNDLIHLTEELRDALPRKGVEPVELPPGVAEKLRELGYLEETPPESPAPRTPPDPSSTPR